MKIEWISVKDRLPEKEGYVLTYDEGGVMDVCMYSPRYKTFNCYDFFSPELAKEMSAKGITHWAECPEPPEPEDSEATP